MMDTKPYTKETDQCPTQPGWTHVACARIRRASIGPHDIVSLPGLEKLMDVVLHSQGPWIDVAPVDRFLALHELNFGDVIDCIDGEGNVELRFVVELEGLDLIWVAERRSVWLGSVRARAAGPANSMRPLPSATGSRAIHFDEDLHRAFEAVRRAEVFCEKVNSAGEFGPELTPEELVQPTLEALDSLKKAMFIDSVRPGFLIYLDLHSSADAIRRRDNHAAALRLGGTLMSFLDNALDSRLAPEEYTPILQIMLLGARLLDVVKMEFPIGLPERNFPWAGELWCTLVDNAEVSVTAFLEHLFIGNLDPTIQSLVALAVATSSDDDWAKLRAAIDAQLPYSRACADVLRKLFLLWTIDNRLLGARGEVCH